MTLYHLRALSGAGCKSRTWVLSSSFTEAVSMSNNETGYPTANFKALMWLWSLPGRQVNRAVAVGRQKALEE